MDSAMAAAAAAAIGDLGDAPAVGQSAAAAAITAAESLAIAAQAAELDATAAMSVHIVSPDDITSSTAVRNSEGNGSDSNSSSDDSEGAGSGDSSDEEEAKEVPESPEAIERRAKEAEENRRIRQEIEKRLQLEEEKSFKTRLRTAHEVVDKHKPVTKPVAGDEELDLVGEVRNANLRDRQVVVQGLQSAMAVDEDSLLCLHDRRVIGQVKK